MKSFGELRIVFMGTPEFAVASLDALVKAGANVVGVITAPDKPSGRGMKMNESAVKKYAVEHDLYILQPEKLKNLEFIAALQALQADVQVVVAFRMLPVVVWNMPPLGTINVHGSLLPKYRGAAPINWAIINGEKETGVTTFRLQHEIDTGNVLLQEVIPIGENETAGELHDKMKETGAALLVKTLQLLAEGKLEEMKQEALSGTDVSALPHAPKLFTDTCKIDWGKTAFEIHNLVRGLSPYPAAFTFLDEKMLKVFACTKEAGQHNLQPGAWETDKKTFLKFACSDGFIHVTDLQLEGKKRMLVTDFLRGYRFAENQQ
ncbi:methionyl-tRNA formyltransferase [Foetidibacter luteolus]|uniref:methionyl-tRNA formyltransferase n=1 Tax=Foetidibacter luteolus TaxID=2608880 RepID=UPI001F011043|nr:methionyl-tRNA formyltransferase [Foetidibacter luteolus]